MRWCVTGSRSVVGELELSTEASVGIVDLREDIARGTTIGHRRLERMEPSPVRRLRLTIDDAVEPPEPVRLGCFSAP